MAKPVYRSVVVKVSGEALMGPENFGIHQPTLERIAGDLIATQQLGVSLGVVPGAGFRVACAHRPAAASRPPR